MSQGQFQAYIGLCRFERFQDHEGTHLIVEPGQTLPTFEAPIACWVASTVEYDELLTVALPKQGYRLLRTEEVMPINARFETKGFNATLGELAAKVSPGRRFHAGVSRPVGFEQSHGIEGPNQTEETKYLTITEHECPPLPDQSHLPIWDHEWIAPELKELLFGQPEQGSCLRTYFIVDATLRKNITRVFDLDTPLVDVPIQCLFKGDAAIELKEVAPYLIDMTVPAESWGDLHKLPGFHQKFFAEHWDHGTGIFVRSHADFDQVFRHFRRITKYISNDGKSYFFRFWESNSVFDYFLGIQGNLQKSTYLFQSRHAKIDSIISHGRFTHRTHAVRPSEKFPDTIDNHQFTFRLDDEDRANLMKSLLRPLAIEVVQELDEINDEIVIDPYSENAVIDILTRMQGYNIHNKGFLKQIAIHEIILGKKVESLDPSGKLLLMLSSNDLEEKKYEAIRDHINDHYE